MQSRDFPVWPEWKRLTCFFHGTLMAMTNERSRWTNGQLANPDKITVADATGRTKYRASLPNHIASVGDTHLLCTLVLLRSYGLFEAHVRFTLEQLHAKGLIPAGSPVFSGASAPADQAKAIEKFTRRSGVEAWGQPFLDAVGRAWSDVHTGRRGLVEVATIRNALAHGQQVVSQEMVNRTANYGGTLPWALGASVELDPGMTDRFRDRLRSVLRVSSNGAAPML